ncbi:hypothetical protein BKE38_01020 [Pseudoroseomonas deserti]|uniref:Uncharacterized protein n=1 Tax=Teichococcus deserti TaxID=1817963 RepID=A0A1V2H8C6_9PROT|nr:hypothetical protein [Pseudoroseomonas deserti]ONG59049.1 hypothetical protein BKE38_01020 [Pseudoroseomonas deserti]
MRHAQASAGVSAHDRAQLVQAVDRHPELRGAAVVFCQAGGCEQLRAAAVYGPKRIVVFELNPAPPSPVPTAVPPARKSKLGWELFQMGLNCGGTALAAVGTIFFSAAAAPTGGVAGVAAVASGAATVAGAAQCAASGYRVYNEVTDQGATNDNLDASPAYQNTMLALDVVGLAGAGAATRGASRFAGTLAKAGASRGGVIAGQTLSRPMRKAITAGLGGSGRYTSIALSARARQELLAVIGAGLSLTGSATGGASRELVVYVAEAL